jgi:NAD+ synthase (glutamine-hydrolysing)
MQDTFPSLALVNNQEPTAELRPQASHQTDEKDLMPYDVLDAIEKAFVRDKKSPVEVLSTIEILYHYDVADLGRWIEKFISLWCRNQWKRERYAPSFHVDDENLDPRSWCRFPILSGGLQAELEQLRLEVQRRQRLKSS